MGVTDSGAYDEPGSVRIYIRLIDANGRLVKGNVTRSFTVLGALVSDVAETIRQALLHA